jgi:mannose-6-phosphate isomerase class I
MASSSTRASLTLRCKFNITNFNNLSLIKNRWMGTYPTLPSYVLETNENLQDVLDKHSEELLGQNIVKKFGHTKLPYLPKVLSIAKALPLQLHPVGLSIKPYYSEANDDHRTKTWLQNSTKRIPTSSPTPTTSLRSR